MGFLDGIASLFNGGPARPKPSDDSKTGKKTVASALAGKIPKEPKSIPDLVERMREDDQVQFSERILIACIKRIDVFVTTDATDTRALSLADNLQQLWGKSLDSLLETIAFGRIAAERQTGYDPATNLTYTTCYEPLPFKMTDMILDENGRFGGVRVKAGDVELCLTKSESAWFAIDRKPLNPYGRSRFLGAPYEVWRKRQSVVGKQQLEDKFFRKFALRGGKLHVEPVVIDEQTGQTIDNIAATAEAYTQTDEGCALVFPNTRFRSDEGGGYRNDYTESPAVLDPNPILSAVDKIDIRMLRAFGIPEKTVIDQGAGSWDLVSLQMLILWAVTEGILQQLVDDFQEQEIDPSVLLNFGPESAVEIKATFTKPSQQPDSVITELAKSLVMSPQLSPLVVSGGLDVRKILESSGIPITPQLEERLAETFKQLQTAVPLQSPLSTPQQLQFDRPGVSSTGPAALANTTGPITPADTIDLQQGFPDVPDQHHLQMESLSLLDQLFSDLVQAAARRDDAEVRRILARVNEVHAQSRIAAAVLGRLTPVKPTIQSKPEGASVGRRTAIDEIPATGGVSPTPFSLANEPGAVGGVTIGQIPSPGRTSGPAGDGTGEDDTEDDAEPAERPLFKFLEAGAAFLREKQIATASELRDIPNEVRRTMISVPGVESESVLSAIRDALAESTRLGETHDDFVARLDGVVSLPASQSRTLLRTEMKSAFVEGMDSTLQKPSVKTYFPYVRFVNTKDGRTRPSHRELGKGVGFVCSIDDPAYKTLRRALEDYNCRCALIPLTESQAKNYGIQTAGDLPLLARTEYGS